MPNPAEINSRIIFDIDQTIAAGVVAAHLTQYNSAFRLGMSPTEILEADSKYALTFDVPQIQNVRQINEEGFQRIRAQIRTSPEVHLNLTPIAGSQAGVETISNSFIHAGYYTVRPAEVEQASHQWLRTNNFPEPDKVVICETPLDKLRKILHDHILTDDFQLKNDMTNVILIDDGLPKLIEAAKILTKEDERYKLGLQRLIIVGFGNQKEKALEGTIIPDINLRALRLSSWDTNEVSGLIARLKTEPGAVQPNS